MIVSLLQLMGFPKGNPVHSRAGETAPGNPSKAQTSGQGRVEHAQASPARREEVKNKTKPTKPTINALLGEAASPWAL